MIHGVGVDIVDIERIRNSVANFGEDFLERVFTPSEIEYSMKRKDPHPSLAARFAAKEAMIKALTTDETIPLKDIEVVVSESGKPSIRPGEKLSEIMDGLNIQSSHLSLTHEKRYAVAYIVLEA
ncbi:holo-ACP synthase [Nitrospirota bacterium]